MDSMAIGWLTIGMVDLDQLVNDYWPADPGCLSQVCVVRSSVTHTPTQTSMHVYVYVYFLWCVYICVSIGVREIIASEPGGECRQAITHGRGVEQSWGLAEKMCWENLYQCTYPVIFLTFPLTCLSFTSSPNIFVTQSKILVYFCTLVFKVILLFIRSIFHTIFPGFLL